MFTFDTDSYARYRPHPPSALIAILLRFARCRQAPVVLDLGCGTGLSAEHWRRMARMLIGVDRSAAMLAEARRRIPELHCIRADACATGLRSQSVDIVVAVQSFHWMEPQATLSEVARLLRPGGVFAAVDTRYPPAIDAEIDVAFDDFLQRAQTLLEDQAPRWSKEGHLRRIIQSKHFRHAREIELHAVERGDSHRFMGFARSAVDMHSLKRMGMSEADLRLDRLAEVVYRSLGSEQVDWHFGYRVRMAVK